MSTDLTTTDLDQRCERFLHRAEHIRIRHMIAGVLELGQAAVEELYAGDLKLARDRSAAQDAPLHLLLQKHSHRMEFLGITVDQVRAAVRAHEVNLELPVDVQGRLSPSHLRALAPVSSVPDRAELAAKALEHTWTVDETEAHVSTFRRKHGLVGKGGRKPILAQVKTASAAARGLAKLGKVDSVDNMTDLERAALRKELENVKATADAWLARLQPQQAN